ncbi:hypothetical protein L3X38_025959 [Prunus dulcis]|uniref:Uncharacterized protein n=1 Tax=Prunus dulcis TaxID=3755 RepID=A0AAD4W2Q2_PRUDU|nr:hypothetical protein L3X38_025959 [Prunus dulcis]
MRIVAALALPCDGKIHFFEFFLKNFFADVTAYPALALPGLDITAGADFGRPGGPFAWAGLSAGPALTPIHLSRIPPLRIHSSKKNPLRTQYLPRDPESNAGSSALALSLMCSRLLVCCRRSDRISYGGERIRQRCSRAVEFLTFATSGT